MQHTRRGSIALVLAFASLAGVAAADDLGPTEWPANRHGECVVVAQLTTPQAYDFHAAFGRHWCLQGWSASTPLLLRETRAERWLTTLEILRGDLLLLTVPMSPYVEQNLERVAAAVVAQVAATLVQADIEAQPALPIVPGAGEPGGERKPSQERRPGSERR